MEQLDLDEHNKQVNEMLDRFQKVLDKPKINFEIMNNVIKTLLEETITNIITNGKCVSVDGTLYFLMDGALYTLDEGQSEPTFIERWDYTNFGYAIIMYMKYLSEMPTMIDGEDIQIVDVPTNIIKVNDNINTALEWWKNLDAMTQGRYTIEKTGNVWENLSLRELQEVYNEVHSKK